MPRADYRRNVIPVANSLQLVDDISRLLDELAGLIQQAEGVSDRRTPAQVWDQVKTHEAVTRRIMDQLGLAITAFLATRPPEDLVTQTYELVTSRVRAWSATSSLYYHIFNTPRQDFDPFEVTDLLLDRRLGGATLAAQMLDNYYLNMVAASAFRLRNRLLAQKLAEKVRQMGEQRQPVRLLNLHTGSARVLNTLIQDRVLRALVEVTCLDTDPTALRRVRQMIEPQLPGRARFRLADPRSWVESKVWPDAPYDLMYAVILFDQLSERQIAPVIATCYQGLRPGGLLVFGNFAASMPAGEHAIIDWVMNWNIRQRSEETLRQTFARTPFDARAVSCELDQLGASWLVMAERTAS